MITIKRVRADAVEFSPLHKAREAYSAALYQAESNHLLDISAMLQPQMNFFGAWIGKDVVGCGGFWEHVGYAEIKSMWVEPKARGQKIGSQILSVIEREALAMGLTVVRLETGIYQPEALGLYRKHGYRDVAPFGDYKLDPLSVFLEKLL